MKVSIETITPEEATAYLKANFKANRAKITSNINRWAIDMKQGRWKLSTDCIAFDVEGRLINGQNSPFSKGDITNYRSTNQALVIDLMDANYLPAKIKNAVTDEIDFYNASN